MDLMMTLIVTLLFAFALAGGWLSRMCGGGPPKLPYGLDQWLYSLPYLLICLPAVAVIAALLGATKESRKRYYPLVLLPYGGAVVGKRTGHGGGIDAGTSEVVRDDEKLEAIIKPLHGKISEYWYDILLLAVTGIATTLVAGIMLAFLNVWAGMAVALSGLTKGPAYMIGWAIYPNGSGKGIPHLNEATAIGEFLTGFFAYLILGVAAYFVLNSLF